MEKLFEAIDEEYTIVYDSKFTSYDSLGIILESVWQTLVKTIVLVRGVSENFSDMAVGDISMFPYRLEIVDFSIPIEFDDLIIAMKKKKHEGGQLFSFLKPFSNETWIAIITTILISRKSFSNEINKHYLVPGLRKL